jgi:hypothetical protein
MIVRNFVNNATTLSAATFRLTIFSITALRLTMYNKILGMTALRIMLFSAVTLMKSVIIKSNMLSFVRLNVVHLNVSAP